MATTSKCHMHVSFSSCCVIDAFHFTLFFLSYFVTNCSECCASLTIIFNFTPSQHVRLACNFFSWTPQYSSARCLFGRSPAAISLALDVLGGAKRCSLWSYARLQSYHVFTFVLFNVCICLPVISSVCARERSQTFIMPHNRPRVPSYISYNTHNFLTYV